MGSRERADHAGGAGAYDNGVSQGVAAA
jgi:hypothetical protein